MKAVAFILMRGRLGMRSANGSEAKEVQAEENWRPSRVETSARRIGCVYQLQKRGPLETKADNARPGRTRADVEYCVRAFTTSVGADRFARSFGISTNFERRAR